MRRLAISLTIDNLLHGKQPDVPATGCLPFKEAQRVQSRAPRCGAAMPARVARVGETVLLSDRLHETKGGEANSAITTNGVSVSAACDRLSEACYRRAAALIR